ncbi:MAG: PorV/PorQ family protein [Gemmatimonadota bacterium]
MSRDSSLAASRRLPRALRAGAIGTLALLALAPGSGAAQDAGSDDSGLIGLMLPLGARTIGLGRAVAATPGELQSLPINPATITGLTRGGLTYSRFEPAAVAEFSGNYLAGAYVTHWGTVAAQVVLLDYGQIVLTDDSPTPIGSVDVSEWVVGLTYANRWRDRLSYGATAKWVKTDFGVTEASGPAFDVGAIYAPRPTLPLQLAIAVRNLGPQLEFDTTATGTEAGEGGEALPARVRVGVSTQPSQFFGLSPDYAVTLAFDVESDLRELSSTSQHAGAAVVVHETLVLRGGVLLLDNPADEEGDGNRQVGGALGIGIRYGSFEADVAREVSVSELGDETHFGVGWRF